MENHALQTVSAFLTAVQQGNTEQLGAILHPQVEWNQPGNNRFSGIKKSVTEAFEMVGGMFQLTANTLALTEIGVMAVNGNRVSCLVRWNAKKADGSTLDVANIDEYTVENGKIIRATVYSADIDQENKFWGN
ncbi:hypothetical protein A3860_14960 [Niastella vici]|uniref:SnoaL-like domain-containing protein n=1 Tax=Niastella vici TaxID=1703345 RepID=A0A1V9G5P1_9BACT|nr:nuclear transport factor 2 family protein [Niastella vici]OQP65890.1 hypothetical protein A3860_14960 [Niastella vici]